MLSVNILNNLSFLSPPTPSKHTEILLCVRSHASYADTLSRGETEGPLEGLDLQT